MAVAWSYIAAHDIYLVGLASMHHVYNILLYLNTYVGLPLEAVAVALMT